MLLGIFIYVINYNKIYFQNNLNTNNALTKNNFSSNYTDTWNIFTNTKYHYSIRYPKIFAIEQIPAEKQPDIKEWQTAKNIGFITISADEKLPKAFSIHDVFIIRIESDLQTINNNSIICSTNIDCNDKLLKESGHVIKQTGTVTRNILGKEIEGIEESNNYNANGYPQIRKNQYFIFSENNRVFLISLDSFVATEKEFDSISTIYDQILLTFKLN